jgi:EpsI family protein
MESRLRFCLVYLLLIVAALFVYRHEELSVPVNSPLSDIPTEQNGWVMSGQTRFDRSVLEVLKPTAYLSRAYVNEEGRQVQLYLGYHGGGPKSGPIHSPRHCLPGSGWLKLGGKKTSLTVGAQDISLVEAVYQKDELRELFLYWYQVRGTTLSDEYALKLTEIRNSLLHNRRDSAFVRVSVLFDGDQAAAAALGEQFIRDFYPAIAGVLPQ